MAEITIRRQVLDVEVKGAESEGLALHWRLPRLCADVLSPALESALAATDPGDAYLYVERMSIDLVDVPLDRLEAELAEALRREVVGYFRRNPQVRYEGEDSTEGTVRHRTASEAAEDGAQGVVRHRTAPGEDSTEGTVRHRTAAQACEDALLVFLRTGRLPWYFEVPPGAHLEQLVLETWGAADEDRGQPPAAQARFREILAMPAARARLTKQFTAEFAIALLRTVSPRLAASMEKVVAVLADPRLSAPSRSAFMRWIRDAAFVAASSRSEPGPEELSRTAWRTSASEGHEDPTLAAVLERQWPCVTEQPAQQALDRIEVVEKPRTGRSQVTSGADADADAKADGFIVENAGIVLLHPFLPRFLQGLGVSDGDVLVDRVRALCLLHYLVTGELSAPEYRLTLEKVICGVALEEPVETDAGLTEAEAEEATALLEAAIGHWAALRGTSPDALRNEFLMRPGLLSVDTYGDWLLRVETRTVDILLDQLPWGISMVAFPWMPGLLRVEWR